MDNALMQGSPAPTMVHSQPTGMAQPGTQAPNPLTQGAAPAQQPTSFTPQQVNDAHDHLSSMQGLLSELLEKPDEELDRKHLFGAASDMVTKHRLSGGKKGIPAMDMVKEMAAPDFPGKDAPPAAIKAFLQRHFDQALIHQAMLTAKFGPPNPALQNAPQSMGNALTQPQGTQP